MSEKVIVERFRIGGNESGGPSMPSAVLQKALGTTIKVDCINQILTVPTEDGPKHARPGDTIVCFDDGTFAVDFAGDWYND